MTKDFWYWLIMGIWLLVGLWADYKQGEPYPFGRLRGNVLLFVLFVLIGLKLFGEPVR